MKKISRSTLGALGVGAIAALVLAVLPVSSAAQPQSAAAVRPNVPGKFVWFDLLTKDAAAAEKFYGALLGWTFEPRKRQELPYKVIRSNGALIGGILDMSSRKADVPESTWLSYVSVADVDKAAAAFKAKGGKVLREPMNLGKVARVSAVTDPSGALLGLVRIAKGDPPDTKEFADRSFFWAEYIAQDAEASAAFYKDVFGYSIRQVDGGAKVVYYALDAGGAPRAGLYTSPWKKEVRPNWLPYVKVADAAAAAAKAKDLGGRVIFEPRAEVRNGSLAIVVDPTGAAVALQKWPFDERASGGTK